MLYMLQECTAEDLLSTPIEDGSKTFRMVTDHISVWPCGRYFFNWQGDEFLLNATNDDDAKSECTRLQFDLESD